MRKRRYENDTSEVANASKRRRVTGSSSALRRRSSRRIPADIDAEETPQHPEPEQSHSAMEGTNEAVGTPTPRRYNFRRRTGAKIISSTPRQTINTPEIIVLSSDSERNESTNDFEVIVISSDSDHTQHEEPRVERNDVSNVPQETGTAPEGPQSSQGCLTGNVIPPETNQESQVLDSSLRSDILATAGIRLSDAVIKPLRPPESTPMVPLGEWLAPAPPQQNEITSGSPRDRENRTTLNLDPSVGTEQALTSAPLTQIAETPLVNTFLRNNNAKCGEVIIRILSDSTSKYELNQLRNLQMHENAGNFIYREKGIFAFQKCPDNNYVCFFGFYVQEYGKDSAEPNRDRVYLSYLDSVPYFEPKNLRTSVYHEILCAYMEYVKMLDFKAVHLWASPPDETIEYIFNSHPPSQQMPDTARLVRWYQLMVNRAIERGIVIKNYTLQEYVTRFCNMPPNCLPYFKGDHWPCIVEQIMQRLRRSSRPSGAPLNEDEFTKKFWSRLRKEIEVSGETFQVYTLKEDQSSHEIADPDALFPIMAMKDREAFLKWCRQNEYEFNTIRRAKYSTKAIFHMYFQELEKRKRRSRRKSL
nr:histone acetyltransferase p300 [Hymenolepis microstoma]